MKNIIQDIITNYPKHYSKMIKNNPEMYNWIITNSLIDPNSQFVEKIYSSINQVNNICKYNNIKKFRNITEGFFNCGRANSCQCTREQVSSSIKETLTEKTDEEIIASNEKRKLTNIEKYGVDNIGKTEKAKINHAKFYENGELVDRLAKKIKATNIERYGVEVPVQNDQIKEKIKQTNIERYGAENPNQNEEIREKTKETNIRRYGVENTFQNEEIKEKIKSTNVEKYGVKYPQQNEDIREKSKQTNLERYGVKWAISSDEVQEKIKATNITRYGSEYPAQNQEIREKTKQTNLERYGVEYNWQSDITKEKIMATNVEKYGVKWAISSDIIREKTKQTNFEKYNSYWNVDKTVIQKYKASNSSQIHISPETLTILQNEELFKEFIKDKSVREICNELNVYDITIYNYINAHNARDLYRKKGPSYLELEMAQFLDSLNIKYELNNRTILNGKEIDFYIPDYNMAIEMNGIYWHSDAIKQDKNYHYDKWKACDDLGIHLVSIFEDDWNLQQDKIKNMMSTHFGLKLKGIPARKSTIKQIDAVLSRPFLEQYHIQGFVGGTHFGAYDQQNNLISVMTFGYTRNQRFELKRFVMDNYNHPGMFSKIFKYAQKELNFTEVVSFSDNTCFTGNVYPKNGFEFIQVIPSDYQYLVNGRKSHKSNFKKDNIRKKFPDMIEFMDAGMTERQIMEKLEIPKVYDCGKKEWLWRNP